MLYQAKEILPYTLLRKIQLEGTRPAEIYRVRDDKVNQELDLNTRKTTIGILKRDETFKEIYRRLTNVIGKEHGYKAHQFNYLIYKEGCFFRRHKDNDKYINSRKITSITIVDASYDLEGGDLLLYDGDQINRLEIPIGWTVWFDSSTEHEVTEVKKGQRISLVSWLG